MNDAIAMPKVKDKVTGCNIRILDDGSYLLTIENTDYSKRKEMSHDNIDSLMSGIHKYLNKKMNKKEHDEEELRKKY